MRVKDPLKNRTCQNNNNKKKLEYLNWNVTTAKISVATICDITKYTKVVHDKSTP